MIIIDHEADRKLMQTLEALRVEPDTTRCLHFKVPQSSMTESESRLLQHHIVTSVEQRLPSLPSQVYMCEDGEVFILAPEMQGKQARQVILDVGTQLNIPADDKLASLYELDAHVNKLLLMVEAKVEKRRKLEQAMRAAREEQEAHVKKQSILLSLSLTEKISDIHTRRLERTNIEMMVIEDDAFSRRLVEKVMKNVGTLTSLASAELAFDTYTRVAPDILFLDINLPDVTGHDLLEQIMRLDPHAYVVMLSGNADRSNITTSMQRGAKGFIAKPFTTEKLFQYLDRCPTIQQKRETHARAH
ncbi:MAG: response regulator [Rickettsiales bacterium]